MQLTFFGAAQNVTGSCYLAEADGARLLVDCGLYQERDFKNRNWEPFPVPPSSLQAVVLTHAHLDHCGRLPRLVKEGFRGPVFCTPATAEIAQLIMKDSAFLQEEDVRHKRLRHAKQGRTSPFPYEPLYTVADAEKAASLLRPSPYRTPVSVAPGLSVEFYEAGHIFGSASVLLAAGQGERRRTVLFSGDVGRPDRPIIRDPAPPAEADYVLIESTYGDRTHGPAADIPGELARVVNETCAAGGNLVIPSFAVERTQELLYHLHALLRANRIPHLFTFVDSPLAIRVTEVMRRHAELFDDETRDLLRRGAHPCDLPGLTMSNTVEQSKAINRIKGSAIIIAGAGMCTGGRIKHHLKNNLGRPESTVLFVGYQAVGTLGRIIQDRPAEVRLFGEMQPVRARIESLAGFSAHADRDELRAWLASLRRPPRRVFVTHGEPSAAAAFCDLLRQEGLNAGVAEYRATAALD